ETVQEESGDLTLEFPRPLTPYHLSHLQQVQSREFRKQPGYKQGCAILELHIPQQKVQVQNGTDSLFYRSAYPLRYNLTSSYFFEKERQPSAQELGLIGTYFPVLKWTQGAPNQTQVSAVLGHLLRDHMEGRDSTGAARTLKFPDGTSAAWYVLTIIGFYGVIFLFRLGSNILRKNSKSLEDIYYLNFTSKLKKKGLQSKAGKCSALTIATELSCSPARPAGDHSMETAGTKPKSKGSLERQGQQTSLEEAQPLCRGGGEALDLCGTLRTSGHTYRPMGM
ncbi:hypothetical protein MC885_005990, partial [Smutsia gigantea]